MQGIWVAKKYLGSRLSRLSSTIVYFSVTPLKILGQSIRLRQVKKWLTLDDTCMNKRDYIFHIGRFQGSNKVTKFSLFGKAELPMIWIQGRNSNVKGIYGSGGRITGVWTFRGMTEGEAGSFFGVSFFIFLAGGVFAGVSFLSRQ